MKAVIGLGTNMGERAENLVQAIRAFELLPHTKIVKYSSVYESKPYGYAEQPNFLNMALILETSISPEALLGACLGIEAGFGRIRRFKNGPRILDLDILLMEGYTSDTELLRVPHPQILNRSFVLCPLYELFPSGVAFDFDFSEAYQRHPKNDIQPYRI